MISTLFLYSGRFLKVFFPYDVILSCILKSWARVPFSPPVWQRMVWKSPWAFLIGQQDADSHLLYFRRACKIWKWVQATHKQAENPLIIVSQCWQRGCETRCFALVGVIFGLCWDSALFSQMRESAAWETPGMQVFACLTAYVCWSVLWGCCGGGNATQSFHVLRVVSQ